MLERVFDMFTQVRVAWPAARRTVSGSGCRWSSGWSRCTAATVEARSEGPGGQRARRAAAAGAEDEPDDRRRARRRRRANAARGARRERILVVDDNVDAAESLSRLLRLQAHEVVVAHDGLAALAAARA